MNSSLNRRNFLKLSVAGAVTGLTTSQAEAKDWTAPGNESRYPIRESDWKNRLGASEIPYDGLVSSLKSENQYVCDIRGELPQDLSGSLFRTGPGIFERGGMRRRMIIDADGMMRKFEFKNGQVTFSNKHIQTEKFRDEAKAGKYLYPSFGMLVPETGLLTNSLAKIKNQASVTAFTFGRRLFATDEIQPVVEIDPATLQTLSNPSPFGTHTYKAHTRITHFGSKLLHLAKFSPVTSKLQFVTYDENFMLMQESQSVKVSRNFHDWHVTKNYYVILLPPAYLNKWGIMKAMAGQATVGDAIEFNRSEQAQVLVIPRDGRLPRAYNLPTALDSWHSVNAFEDGAGKIVFDFIASKNWMSPVSSKSPICKIMMGDLKVDKSLRPTVVSRVLIDYVANKASYGADHFKLHGVEMPTIDSKRTGLSTASAYFVAGQEGLDSQLIRLDYQNKTLDRYDFGPGQFVTEPIYARSTIDAKRGYILSEAYSRADRKSRLTIFDGQNLAAGPIAEVLLNHHLPLGFHGFWAD